jgi:serine/threonine protein kinase
MAQWRQKFVAVKVRAFFPSFLLPATDSVILCIQTVSAVTTEDMQALYDEAALNTQIPMHKNVLRTFGLVCEGQQYSLVKELAPKGSLLSALDTNRAQNRCFNFFSQLKLLRGILSGMSVISKSGIVHRDLAARNILLGQSLEPKIADFGFSRNIGSQKEGQTQSDLGTPRRVIWHKNVF